jgi:hypothetical protein
MHPCLLSCVLHLRLSPVSAHVCMQWLEDDKDPLQKLIVYLIIRVSEHDKRGKPSSIHVTTIRRGDSPPPVPTHVHYDYTESYCA